MPLSKDNVKLLPLGANCQPYMQSAHAPVFDKVSNTTYHQDTGVPANYINNPATECAADIVYLNSSQHAIVKLPSQQGSRPRLIKKYVNSAGGDKFNQHVQDLNAAQRDITGVFSSGFSSCGFQIAHVVRGHDQYLVVSHLQSGSALENICSKPDVNWDTDNNIDWVINTTLCNLGSVYQCYGTGALQNDPGKTLNLIRGVSVFPNHELLVNSFALTNAGILLNNDGGIRFYFAGSRPPSISPNLRYFASAYRHSWMIRPGEAFSLSQVSQRDLQTRYEDFLRRGYMVDLWNLPRLSELSKTEADNFIERCAAHMANGNPENAQALILEIMPNMPQPSPQNNCRTRHYLTSQQIGQWVAGAPFASEHYAPVGLRI